MRGFPLFLVLGAFLGGAKANEEVTGQCICFWFHAAEAAASLHHIEHIIPHLTPTPTQHEKAIFSKAKIGEDKKLNCKSDLETVTWKVILEDSNETQSVEPSEKYEMTGEVLKIEDVQESELGVYR